MPKDSIITDTNLVKVLGAQLEVIKSPQCHCIYTNHNKKGEIWWFL